jgi:hypothetical protein
LQAFLSQVKKTTDILTRFGDKWQVVVIPADDTSPVQVVYPLT